MNYKPISQEIFTLYSKLDGHPASKTSGQQNDNWKIAQKLSIRTPKLRSGNTGYALKLKLPNDIDITQSDGELIK